MFITNTTVYAMALVTPACTTKLTSDRQHKMVLLVVTCSKFHLTALSCNTMPKIFAFGPRQFHFVFRVEDQQRRKLTGPIKVELPNPMDFINKNDLASTSLYELITEQRHTLLLECTELLDIIPHQFYSRVIVGLFCFVRLYESYLSKENEYSCLAEIEDWTDMWIRLLASSLLGKFSGAQQETQTQINFPTDFIPPVHHILCGLMVATDSFKLLKSYSITHRKVLKGLDRLILNSSGFTSLWLKTMKFYFE